MAGPLRPIQQRNMRLIVALLVHPTGQLQPPTSSAIRGPLRHASSVGRRPVAHPTGSALEDCEIVEFIPLNVFDPDLIMISLSVARLFTATRPICRWMVVG